MSNLQPTTNKGEIAIYQPDNSIHLEVLLQNETIWLSQKLMAELFDVDRTSISRHLKNIFSDEELDEKVVSAFFAHTTQHGAITDKTQTIETLFYNLDAIIAVGYRVNSKRATAFRQWATGVLKDYILKGYAINQRFERIEERVSNTEHQIDFFVKTALPPVEGIFYDGQIFDAYAFVSNLIKSAKKWFAFSKMKLSPL